MTTIISRRSWGAERLGNDFAQMGSIYGVTIHWNGPGMGPYTHNHCDDRLRSMQNYHIHGNGWNDIGYNFVVCRHGSIFEGRGLFAIGAHAGESSIGGNSHWYGVQAMFGSGDDLTDEMVHGLQEAVKYLRKSGRAGDKINGHRNHHSTDCPGDELYRLVHSGKLMAAAPTKPTTPPQPPQEEDHMDYTSAAHSGSTPVEVPSGEWTDVWFDTVYQDPTKAFGEGKKPQPTILVGRKDYTMEAGVTLAAEDSGSVEGVHVQLRTVEYKYVPASGSEPARDDLVETGLAHTSEAEADGQAASTFVGRVNDKQKLRLQVRHDFATPLKIAYARVAARSETL